MTDRWIVITRWDGKDGFQHYRDRDPVWIKNYRSLLKSDQYRELTLTQRGALHGLWLEYAASNREIRDSTLAITRRLGQRVTRATLDALNHAGFIEYSASKPLAPRYPDAMPEEETEKEVEKDPPTPHRRGGTKPSRKKPQKSLEPPVPEIELPPAEERLRIAAEVRAQLLGVAAAARAANPDNGNPLPPLTAYLDTEPDPEETE